jgi:hypothetical protein
MSGRDTGTLELFSPNFANLRSVEMMAQLDRALQLAAALIRGGFNDGLEAADDHRELASFANDYLPAFEVNQDLADLRTRGTYQIGQLSLGEVDPNKDSARVPYSKLKNQLEQRYRYPFGHTESKEARIAPDQIPQTAIRAFCNSRVIRGKDSEAYVDEAIGGQLADSAIVKRSPLEVVVEDRRHQGHSEDHAGRQNCHHSRVQAVEMAEFGGARQQNVGVEAEHALFLEDDALVTNVSACHRVVEAFEL